MVANYAFEKLGVVCRELPVSGRMCEFGALRNRTTVFTDRTDAGDALAALVSGAKIPRALILAVPSGGVPVARALARRAGWPLDVAVVSKITLPWNTEAGYGAVAFDGSCRLNREMIRFAGLTERQVEEGIAGTREKVARRGQAFRRDRPATDLRGQDVLLVDDGLASGFTLLTGIEALRRAGVDSVVVAVPTGHEAAVLRLSGEVDAICCANIRGGDSFSVAAAYRYWTDVNEEEAFAMLAEDNG